MRADYCRDGASVLRGDICTINIKNMKYVINGMIETGTIVRVVIDANQTDWMQSSG
jgi:anti-anti-sigma regulatory factor